MNQNPAIEASLSVLCHYYVGLVDNKRFEPVKVLPVKVCQRVH